MTVRGNVLSATLDGRIGQRISLGGDLEGDKFTNKKELGPERPSDTSSTPSNARNPFLYIFSKLFMLQRSSQLRRSSEIHHFRRQAPQNPDSTPISDPDPEASVELSF